MFDVSVIINYNCLQTTSGCIDNIVEKTSGISYEIIVVDNASTDGSREFFCSDERVKYIYYEENLGFGRANNRGLEIASGRNILFLNPDTLLRNNAIEILSDYLDNLSGNQMVCATERPRFPGREKDHYFEDDTILSWNLIPDMIRNK